MSEDYLWIRMIQLDPQLMENQWYLCEEEESDDEIIDLTKDEESDYIDEANNSDDDY